MKNTAILRITIVFAVITILCTSIGLAYTTRVPISREFILENAHLSYDVNWRCDPENAYGTSISGGSCPYGTTSGWKDNSPYCWGGYHDVYSFLENMTNGLGAGDKNTSSSSPYYSGLVSGSDCSGYASQCFRSGRYTTSGFPSVTTDVGWDNLAPGDAMNKAGSHIRLIEKYPTDTGDVLVYESTGFGWQVQHRVIPRDNSYSAVRYNRTIDMPSILDVLQSGAGAVTITWLGYADTGFRIYQSTNATDWTLVKDENDLDSDTDTAEITGLLDNVTYYFKIVSLNGAVETSPSSIYPARLASSGSAPVLIVDGYDRWVRKNTPNSFHEFLVSYAAALDFKGVDFETTNNFRVTRSEIDLSLYSAVVWMCGDDSTSEYALNILEMKELETYLAGGGKLFITGSEIGWDLVSEEVEFDNINFDESDFFNNYLKAQHTDDDAGVYDVTGTAGSIFEGLSFSFDNGTHGTYDAAYPDELGANGGSTVNLTYDGAGNAGIQYTGVFGSGVEDGQVVFLGFPYETIYPETARTEVMTAVMVYFGLAENEDDPPVFDGLVRTTPMDEGAYLEWEAAEDASGPISYNIYVAETSGGQDFGSPVNPAGSVLEIHYSLSGLVNDQVYYVVVRAEDRYGTEETNTVERIVRPGTNMLASGYNCDFEDDGAPVAAKPAHWSSSLSIGNSEKAVEFSVTDDSYEGGLAAMISASGVPANSGDIATASLICDESITLTAGHTYAYSAMVKRNKSNWFRLVLVREGYSTFMLENFDALDIKEGDSGWEHITAYYTVPTGVGATGTYYLRIDSMVKNSRTTGGSCDMLVDSVELIDLGIETLADTWTAGGAGYGVRNRYFDKGTESEITAVGASEFIMTTMPVSWNIALAVDSIQNNAPSTPFWGCEVPPFANATDEAGYVLAQAADDTIPAFPALAADLKIDPQDAGQRHVMTLDYGSTGTILSNLRAFVINQDFDHNAFVGVSPIVAKPGSVMWGISVNFVPSVDETHLKLRIDNVTIDTVGQPHTEVAEIYIDNVVIHRCLMP